MNLSTYLCGFSLVNHGRFTKFAITFLTIIMVYCKLSAVYYCGIVLVKCIYFVFSLAECFNLCFRLLDGSDSLVATSNPVAIKHVPRQSNTSTSSADDIRDNRDSSVDNTDDSFRRYERIRRTLSHSRRRYSTIQRKARAERDALKQSNKENAIIASGSYEASGGSPKGKQDDLETSLSLDRDSSEVADREMAELSGSDDDKGADLDDSLKASKTFSSLRRGAYSSLFLIGFLVSTKLSHFKL